jgi:Flp pilus assembly protein TadG
MQLLVIMVPVLFGLMGFAVDLGRLYLIRGELNEAANAMALAAAGQLIGTSASLQNAATAMNVPLDPTLGDANMYNFGSVAIGSTTGTLSSTVATPTFFSTLTDAINPTSTNYADGTTAQYAQVSITADAPLLFWSLLTLGQSQKTTIAAFAAAGISAPLCTACSMEDFAVAALDQTDTVNFGFTFNTKYTFYFDCTGRNTISLLGDSTATVPYVLIDRYNSNLTLDETQQLFRIGAGGLIPLPVSTPNLALECFAIGGQEYLWGGAGTGATVTAPGACTSSSENQQVQEMLCGVYSRFDDPNNVAGAEAPVCTTITDLADIATAYSPDTDTSDYDDYTAYQGNGRRILTVPIVDSLQTSDTGVMNVLGFRQFFVTPTPDSATGLGNDPGDTHGRFMAIYIGSVAPVKQGYFAVNTNAFSTAPASACGVTSGPGKVVLHQ